jgi:hypothetical protein
VGGEGGAGGLCVGVGVGSLHFGLSNLFVCVHCGLFLFCRVYLIFELF